MNELTSELVLAIRCEECGCRHAIGCSLHENAPADLWLCDRCADDCGFCPSCGVSQLEQVIQGHRGVCAACSRAA